MCRCLLQTEETKQNRLNPSAPSRCHTLALLHHNLWWSVKLHQWVMWHFKVHIRSLANITTAMPLWPYTEKCTANNTPTFTSPFSPSDFLSRSRSLSLLFFFLLVERSRSSRLRSLSFLRSLSLSLSLFFSFLCLHRRTRKTCYCRQVRYIRIVHFKASLNSTFKDTWWDLTHENTNLRGDGEAGVLLLGDFLGDLLALRLLLRLLCHRIRQKQAILNDCKTKVPVYTEWIKKMYIN